MAKALMIQGTMSSAGKSLLTAGLCRILKQDGLRVAPFKSQNMALNSFITDEGLEMGRAQVMQAEAAGLAPSVDMNPILLKPTGEMGSQVIVRGEVLGNMRAADYFRYKKKLIPDILRAYESLSSKCDVVLIEGAGSPAEINLKQDDIVNMGLARMVDAPVLLVGDIDRGGVFAQLYGTVALLDPDERARIKGTIINKFRGDVEILRPGLATLEQLTGVPVLGVVPYLHVDVDDEDSLAPRLSGHKAHKVLDIAVVRLPRISNFTDFNALESQPCAGVRYVRAAKDLGQPDLIILPGTKSTLEDLLWLRQSGLEASIQRLCAKGTPVIGICGGYQMLGMEISDPEGVEGGGSLRGMGLLPIRTVFAGSKTRTRVTGCMASLPGCFAPLSGASFTGYEIHMGRTEIIEERGCAAATLVQDGCSHADGCARDNVLGLYAHGLFDEGDLAQRLTALLLRRKGLDESAACAVSYETHKQQQYDLLAEGMRSALDMDAIYRIIGL